VSSIRTASPPPAVFVRPQARGTAARPASLTFISNHFHDGASMAESLFGFAFFKRRREYGALFIRLIVGSFIIYGVQDNVFSYRQMEEFAHFLAARGVPFPLFAAFLSAYTQLVCGVCILLGAFVRLISVPFIINFIVAILIAHRGDSFRGMFPALVMIFVGLFFLFHGAGKPSFDEWREGRGER
jgi:putative oxidoreductase